MTQDVDGQGGRTVFGALDGIRGVAALTVVVFHAPALFSPLTLPSAYLAVDLFFALSGFVIDHAYGGRLDGGMGVRGFMRARLVRLYPLYILGAFLGAVKALAALKLGGGALDAGGLATAAATSVLILPSPTFAQAPQLFPLNSPAWSLFFELVINLIFVLAWRWLSLRVVVVGALLMGGLLVGLVLISGGMGLGDTWSTVGFGLLRAMTSFLVGVALHRAFVRRERPQLSGAVTWVLPLLLIPVFALAPSAGWKIAYDLFFIALAAPVCIWICAHLAPGRRLGGVYAFLGAASYAVYILHYPVVELVRRVLQRELAQGWAPWLGLAFLAAMVAGAWAIDLIYDRPARRWLGRLLSPRA